MANGTIAFDTLQTSGQIDGTARSIDTDYLLNGCAKVWNHGATNGTFSKDSFNVTSTTDNGTGDTTVTFTNNMVNDDWAGGGMAGGNNIYGMQAQATSSARTLIHSHSGSDNDTGLYSVTVQGELA